MSERIYKLVDCQSWRLAVEVGEFVGAAIDLQDGYIHFSSATQVAETAMKHFAGVDDLLLVAVETSRLGKALRWEPSRGGQLFPHLYAKLAVADIAWAEPLHRDAQGNLTFPREIEI